MKTVRLTIRLPATLKEKVQSAACRMSVSVTEFAKIALEEQADQILNEQQLLVLANEDRDRLLTALASPARPVSALQEAFRWYKEVAQRS